HDFNTPPAEVIGTPFDEQCFMEAMKILKETRWRVGIYAGQGCLDYSEQLVRLAEVLQAPVATSVSGKGVIPDCHPLSVGWGYGPQAGIAAENVFKSVDTLIAIGVKFSEVSTGFYSNPQPKHVIHVDANKCNIGRVLSTDVCVHA